jgi:hypothetical protein
MNPINMVLLVVRNSDAMTDQAGEENAMFICHPSCEIQTYIINETILHFAAKALTNPLLWLDNISMQTFSNSGCKYRSLNVLFFPW